MAPVPIQEQEDMNMSTGMIQVPLYFIRIACYPLGEVQMNVRKAMEILVKINSTRNKEYVGSNQKYVYFGCV